MDPHADVLFEVSWEVCNKVGGIYTVVTSKAEHMQNAYKKYFLIGPYFQNKIFGMFEETAPEEQFKNAFEQLKKEGIECHSGKWLIKGTPTVILIDFTKYTTQKNDIKRKLWDDHHIDSLNTEWFDFDEPVVFSDAAGRTIHALSNTFQEKKIVAHFHEWLTGAGLLHLKNAQSPVATVFTTHATTLGRTIATNDRNIYEILDTINPDQNAATRGHSIKAKHLLEKAAAQHANIFTTVSEITGIEAEKTLGRKPDVILPNGLDMEKFPTFEQAAIRHKQFKARLMQFATYYFFPHYTFDLKNTLVYFLAGRYEFYDKGIDVAIHALAQLNQRLKKEHSPKTIITFFWVPSTIRSIKQELLENKTFFTDIKDSLDDEEENIHNTLLSLLISKKEIKENNLFDEDFLHELKPKLRRLTRTGLPPLATHDLHQEEKDDILNTLKQVGLHNREEDRVKVVFYPIYLTGADGLLDTSYYESMQGSHLGLFPSYYEPWGYTPLEAGALGVSSVTTDLAGFGRFLTTESEQEKYPGIFVLKRYQRKWEQIVNDLADFMHYFANLTAEERVKNKMAAKRIAATADWAHFMQNYIEAHNKALGN